MLRLTKSRRNVVLPELGTPAITTRGMKEDDMSAVADLIDRAIMNRSDEAALEEIKKDVVNLAEKFPVPGI